MSEKRRLSDKIMDAHQMACDEGKLEVADYLIRALEAELSGIGSRHRKERRQATNQLELALGRRQDATRKA